MKRALRDKWAAALEGGKFEQTDGCLRNGNNECCCLGVLADVYNPDMWFDPDPDSGDHAYGTPEYRGELPPSVLDEVGLTTRQQGEFIKMNDDENMSFERIAERVRELPVED